MKFLVDAQLPRRMCRWFAIAGCDAIHTLQLPTGNRTTDAQLIDLADRDQRAVITKDTDFVDSHVLHMRPTKLRWFRRAIWGIAISRHSLFR